MSDQGMSGELDRLKHSYALLEEERQRLSDENSRLREALYQIGHGHVPANWNSEIARAALEGKE